MLTDEAHQNLTFHLVSYTNSKMFGMVPKLDVRPNAGSEASGQLVGVITFNTTGNPFVSVLEVVCVDDGPNLPADGSINTSPVATLTLTVIPNNNPPNFKGIRPGDTGEPRANFETNPDVC
jgi:hypothetical protein